MTKQTFVISRTSKASGRKLFLTVSRVSGASFEAPGNTVTGVGVANLKTWGTAKGAQHWLDARPGFAEHYTAMGDPLVIEEIK